ncbi:MAG: hypothetical protein U0232_19305 [Thermomicrobiales bacterium]
MNTSSMGRAAPRYARPFVSPLLAFAVVLALWLAFGALLAANPAGLGDLWDTLQNLWRKSAWSSGSPSPWVLGLWAWQADWSLWLRLAVVGSLAVATAAAFFPRTRDR